MGDTESGTLAGTAVLLAALAIVAIAWPAVIGWPIGLIAIWFAINTGIRALHLRQRRLRRNRDVDRHD